MPWELSATPRPPATTLGTVEQVHALLRSAVPTIEFWRDPPGTEKLKAMQDKGIEVPPVIRDGWLADTGAFKGVYEGSNFSIEFWLGYDEQSVNSVPMDVRGSGDPMTIVERLMAIEVWVILDVAGNAPTIEGWKSFGTWRDESIQRLGDGT